jgi:hypothetical protein
MISPRPGKSKGFTGPFQIHSTRFRYSYSSSNSAVIARSQRVRAKRGPMTGSATKQSRASRETLDCFAFARNDGEDIGLRPRDDFPPSFANYSPSKSARAQGRPGGRCTRGPRARKIARRARDHRHRRRHSDLPCAMVYGLYALSSVNQRLPPSPSRSSQLR